MVCWARIEEFPVGNGNGVPLTSWAASGRFKLTEASAFWPRKTSSQLFERIVFQIRNWIEVFKQFWLLWSNWIREHTALSFTGEARMNELRFCFYNCFYNPIRASETWMAFTVSVDQDVPESIHWKKFLARRFFQLPTPLSGCQTHVLNRIPLVGKSANNWQAETPAPPTQFTPTQRTEQRRHALRRLEPCSSF
jgi:hypothetical protein